MQQQKKAHPKIKSNLHPRSKHRERYNFKKLIVSHPELAPFVALNKYNDESIDFFNPEAVKALNTALLKHHYTIDYWDIPKHYLCPPIPGRADYIHHISDLLWTTNPKSKNSQVKCLDVGVGANCIYPIIGNASYGWSFIGSDIDPVSIASANKIIASNPYLKGKIEVRLQSNPTHLFQGIIRKDERFDLTICNPPFHASLKESQAGSLRKLKNLKQKRTTKPLLNFGGQHNELWCKGGEETFVRNMIYESKKFATSCLWFTTLISKQSHLKSIYKTLEKVKTVQVKTIPMGQGNKVSRIVAWTFFNQEQQQQWSNVK